MSDHAVDVERCIATLAANLRAHRPQLERLWDEINALGGYENRVYRFYHRSFKAFDMQADAEKIAAALRSVAPEGRPLCGMFEELLRAGTGRVFEGKETNEHWLQEAGPIVAAYLHSRFLLEMAVKVASDPNPDCGVIGYPWATILALFDLR